MKLFALIALLFLPLAAFAQEFIPLTGIPGLQELRAAGNGDTLSDFFNALYKICIGAAATIAVFNIMYAGFRGMLNEGSVLEKGKIRDRIKNSLLGLLLVLSPAIVFGVIDPRILNLEIDFSRLKPTNVDPFGIEMGGRLSEDEREALGLSMVDIARECGITISSEQEECFQQNVGGASGQCYPSDVTTEQASCVGRESNERAATCSALTIQEGTLVPNESLYCCAQAGFRAVRHSSDGETYRCSAPQTSDTSNPTITAAAGTYNFILYSGAANNSCVNVVHGSYATNQECTAALQSERTSRTGYSSQYGDQCQQPPLNTFFSVPICSGMVTLP